MATFAPQISTLPNAVTGVSADAGNGISLGSDSLPFLADGGIVFLASTTLDAFAAPAIVGEPTEAEVAAWNASLVNPLRNAHVEYNGTDVDTEDETHLWFIDANGLVVGGKGTTTDSGRTVVLVGAADASPIDATVTNVDYVVDAARTAPLTINMDDADNIAAGAGFIRVFNQGAANVGLSTDIMTGLDNSSVHAITQDQFGTLITGALELDPTWQVNSSRASNTNYTVKRYVYANGGGTDVAGVRIDCSNEDSIGLVTATFATDQGKSFQINLDFALPDDEPFIALAVDGTQFPDAEVIFWRSAGSYFIGIRRTDTASTSTTLSLTFLSGGLNLIKVGEPESLTFSAVNTPVTSDATFNPRICLDTTVAALPLTFETGAVTDVTAISGTTGVYNVANPASGETSINTIEYYDEGFFRYVKIDMEASDDDLSIYELAAPLMPTGGRIIDAQTMSTDENFNVGTVINAGLISAGDNRFLTNRVDSINDDNAFSVTLKIYNPTAVPSFATSAVQVEDVEVVLFAEQLGITGPSALSLDGGVAWDDVKNDYDHIRFECQMNVSSVGLVEQPLEMPSSRIVQNSRVRPEYGSGHYNLIIGDTATGDFAIPDFATMTDYGLRIVGVKAQSTVIPLDEVAVNDQAATSDYIDIGDMRMAWGISVGGNPEVITFPAGGFAVAPSITFNVVDNNPRETSINAATATTATLEVFGGAPKHWQAIGLKP